MNQAEDKKKRFSKSVLAEVGALNRFAFSLCKNNFDADDLVSETIVKAYENFSKLKDETKTKPIIITEGENDKTINSYVCFSTWTSRSS